MSFRLRSPGTRKKQQPAQRFLRLKTMEIANPFCVQRPKRRLPIKIYKKRIPSEYRETGIHVLWGHCFQEEFHGTKKQIFSSGIEDRARLLPFHLDCGTAASGIRDFCRVHHVPVGDHHPVVKELTVPESSENVWKQLEELETPLPASREEFENRAILYHILMDLEEFLKMKKKFVDSLTEDQMERYWQSNG